MAQRALVLLSIISSSAAEQVWEVNEHHNTHARFGDMMLTPAQAARYGKDEGGPRGVAVKETATNRWPNNVIPYTISPLYSQYNQRFLRTSLMALELVSCFKFVERTDEQDYLQIAPLDGCYSFVGRTGGRQVMSLSNDCFADYIIWHEMLHAIGFEHEHQRPDRDHFIKVEYSNVQNGQMGSTGMNIPVNFEKLRADTLDVSTPYDYKSIMHYDSFAFGRFDPNTRRRMQTMVPIRKDVTLEDNYTFSTLDLRKLKTVGKCDEIAEKSPEAPCSDFSMDTCRAMASRGLCNVDRYKALMTKECPVACKRCPDNNVKVEDILGSPAACQDESANCRHLAASGFCTNDFYKDHWKDCARSCKLC